MQPVGSADLEGKAGAGRPAGSPSTSAAAAGREQALLSTTMQDFVQGLIQKALVMRGAGPLALLSSGSGP